MIKQENKILNVLIITEITIFVVSRRNNKGQSDVEL